MDDISAINSRGMTVDSRGIAVDSRGIPIDCRMTVDNLGMGSDIRHGVEHNTPSRRRQYSDRVCPDGRSVDYIDTRSGLNELPYDDIRANSEDINGAPSYNTDVRGGSTSNDDYITDTRNSEAGVTISSRPCLDNGVNDRLAPEGELCMLASTQAVKRSPPDAVYRLGLFGWRRRCLYGLLLFLTATVTLNLALTLFFMRVLDFSSVR